MLKLHRIAVAVLFAGIALALVLGGHAHPTAGDTSVPTVPDSVPSPSPTVTSDAPSSTTSPSSDSSPMTIATTAPPGRDYNTPDVVGVWNEQMPDEVLTRVNRARAEQGLPALTMDTGAMMEAARTRAKEITADFAHKRPNGDHNFTVFDQYDVPYRFAGENLAAGQPTADIVFDGWWNSETHRANMMNQHFTHVSIVALWYDDEYFWVQLFRG